MKWEANKMRVASQVKRLLDEGFSRRDIIDAHKEGIFEGLAEN